jgi:uncharacterized protein YdaU (DUF1376 family)
MRKLPFLRLYTKDWIANQRVALMTPLEEHAYFRLVMYCWQDGQIPPDVARLAVLCKQSPETMEDLWRAIKDCFKPTETGYVHSRVEEERQDALRRAQANKENGQKGARVRYGSKRPEKAA